MPFPAQKDGKFCSVVGPDYHQAINIHSKHKAAARAWIDWFTDKSGYAQTRAAIPTLKGRPLPADLEPTNQDAGVTYIELAHDKTATVDKIDKAVRDRPLQAGLPRSTSSTSPAARPAATWTASSPT